MEKEISIIIPNFNGSSLLEKNLPQIIKSCSGSQIIVVDDASTDNSISILESKFKEIEIIKLTTNHGFAYAVNKGVEKAINDLILLLNTDTSPRQGFLKYIYPYFNNKKTFAVGLADRSHENKAIVIRGRGGGIFKRGFLNHFSLSPQKGETLWVSGGSGIYDKKKFLELGGFDTNFAPFYWEDIDLSYRAQKMGYQCFFEPNAVVDHYHEEGSIKKNKSKSLIKSTSYKNQFLFVWKNISNYTMLCQHVLWLPLHIIKALIRADVPFFVGLFWALSKIPLLILNTSYKNQILSDKEVLSKFEKQ